MARPAVTVLAGKQAWENYKVCNAHFSSALFVSKYTEEFLLSNFLIT